MTIDECSNNSLIGDNRKGGAIRLQIVPAQPKTLSHLPTRPAVDLAFHDLVYSVREGRRNRKCCSISFPFFRFNIFIFCVQFLFFFILLPFKLYTFCCLCRVCHLHLVLANTHTHANAVIAHCYLYFNARFTVNS